MNDSIYADRGIVVHRRRPVGGGSRCLVAGGSQPLSMPFGGETIDLFKPTHNRGSRGSYSELSATLKTIELALCKEEIR